MSQLLIIDQFDNTTLVVVIESTVLDTPTRERTGFCMTLSLYRFTTIYKRLM